MVEAARAGPDESRELHLGLPCGCRGPLSQRRDLSDSTSSQGDDQRLYEFIVRHFLACCSQDAQGQETTVEIDIAQERFVAHGLMILARNYLDVYPYDHWSDKVKGQPA